MSSSSSSWQPSLSAGLRLCGSLVGAVRWTILLAELRSVGCAQAVVCGLVWSAVLAFFTLRIECCMPPDVCM